MTSPNQENTELPFPEHWEMRVDTRTGMPYFLNHAEHFTTWDDPRYVQCPRGMINPMGSMMRRSASPSPSASPSRQQTVPPNLPFKQQFLSPQNTDMFTQSLPRRTRAGSQPPRTMAGDDWFNRTNDRFFDDSSLFGMHHPSPFANNQRSWSPFNRRSPVNDESEVSIPIRTEIDREEPQNREQRPVREKVLIPTQYKINKDERLQNADLTQDEAVSEHTADSPRPKLLKQEDNSVKTSSGDEALAAAALKRMNSEYDNTDSSATGQVSAEKPTSTKTSSCGSDNTTESCEHSERVATENGSDSSITDEPPPPKSDIEKSYESIEKTRREVDSYKDRVEGFSGTKMSKEYRFLDEMLSRCQLALDNVEAHGDSELRKKRKEVVTYIESFFSLLDSKTSS